MLRLPASTDLLAFSNPELLDNSGRYVIILTEEADLKMFPGKLTDDGLVMVSHGSLRELGEDFECHWDDSGNDQVFTVPKIAVRYILGELDKILWVNRELLKP